MYDLSPLKTFYNAFLKRYLEKADGHRSEDSRIPEMYLKR